MRSQNNFSSQGGHIQRRTDELIEHPLLRNVARLFAMAGFELYLVGGSVRDALLGRAHSDFDFATNASPEETLRVIRGFADDIWQIGMEFGTIGLAKAQSKLEITTFREEKYLESSRRPEVSFTANIESDLSRRDFTINSMAIKLPDGDFIDPFGGLTDLASGRLRTPADPAVSFTDDPLRMLRAWRFAAVLDVTPDRDLIDTTIQLRDRLEIVSSERIRDEFSKLLVSQSPGRAILGLVETGLAGHFLPELADIAKLHDPANRHKDVLKHTIMVLESVPCELELRLAALLHDIGKSRTMTDGPDGIHFFHHEVVGAKMARRRLKKLRFPTKVIEEVTALIESHMRFHTYRLGWSDKAVRKYIREVGTARLPALSRLVRADCTTQNAVLSKKFGRLLDELEMRIEQLEAEEESAKIRPPLDGQEVMRFLDIQPGPDVGKVLSMLLEARLDNQVRTKKEAYELTRQWAREHLDIEI